MAGIKEIGGKAIVKDKTVQRGKGVKEVQDNKRLQERREVLHSKSLISNSNKRIMTIK